MAHGVNEKRRCRGSAALGDTVCALECVSIFCHFANSALEFKGGPGVDSSLSVGKSHARNISHSEPHPKPRPQTDPNQAKPHQDSIPPLARRPCVARVTRGARVASYRKKPRTRHAPRALSKARALELEEKNKDTRLEVFFCSVISSLVL